MESINVVIDDEEVERPSSGEENHLDLVDLLVTSTYIIKASPSVSLAESPSTPTTTDTIASASKDEDTPANPHKRSWVKLSHPPQQLLGTVDERRRPRNRVIQPTSQEANQVSYSCYLAQTEPKKVDEALQDESWVSAMHASSINSPEMMFGLCFLALWSIISLVPSGFSRTKQMSMVLWSGIKHVLSPRDILR